MNLQPVPSSRRPRPLTTLGTTQQASTILLVKIQLSQRPFIMMTFIIKSSTGTEFIPLETSNDFDHPAAEQYDNGLGHPVEPDVSHYHDFNETSIGAEFIPSETSYDFDQPPTEHQKGIPDDNLQFSGDFSERGYENNQALSEDITPNKTPRDLFDSPVQRPTTEISQNDGPVLSDIEVPTTESIDSQTLETKYPRELVEDEQRSPQTPDSLSATENITTEAMESEPEDTDATPEATETELLLLPSDQELTTTAAITTSSSILSISAAETTALFSYGAVWFLVMESFKLIFRHLT
ncbi:hypothetical protein QBC38DRAFT_452314 [Podospora fimiseda]|uniref:Uncharacterized protein n=1 Tax=Podospora fimiseda TaxID=252190 RepID=A0AAN7H424_9PEZI|nr:hypothetical protein QBC38DRAFT_452314 [Podospora fimiseda]